MLRLDHKEVKRGVVVKFDELLRLVISRNGYQNVCCSAGSPREDLERLHI